MTNFDKVRESFDDLPYMQHAAATWLRDFIIAVDARNIREIGFYHGKSSAYFSAILEDLGRGQLTSGQHRT